MKVIFLDIDGVLNNADTMAKKSGKLAPTMVEQDLLAFDEDLVANLNYIVEETGAKIVISSSWRYMRTDEQMQELLDLSGGKVEVIGHTDIKYARFEAILLYLDTHNIESYVCLDDDTQDCEILSRSVKQVLTTFEKGLSKNKAWNAICILNADYPKEV